MPASISLATTCRGALTTGTTTACSAGAIRGLGPVGVLTSAGARSLALPSARPTLLTASRVRTGCSAPGLVSPWVVSTASWLLWPGLAMNTRVVSTVTWLLWPGLAMSCVHCQLASLAWLGHEHKSCVHCHLASLAWLGHELCHLAWPWTQGLESAVSCRQTLCVCGNENKRFSLSVTAAFPSLAVVVPAVWVHVCMDFLYVRNLLVVGWTVQSLWNLFCCQNNPQMLVWQAPSPPPLPPPHQVVSLIFPLFCFKLHCATGSTPAPCSSPHSQF